MAALRAGSGLLLPPRDDSVLAMVDPPARHESLTPAAADVTEPWIDPLPSGRSPAGYSTFFASRSNVHERIRADDLREILHRLEQLAVRQ